MLTLVDDVDIDGGGSDKDKFIALADFMGGKFSLDSSKGPFVSAWLATTPGFYVDSPINYVHDGCCKDFGFRATQVPEPGTLALLGAGLLGLGLTRRRRRV